MYRTFLSWRWLLARRTNWIGIVGIFLGVGAMILILSIMSGFLGETRDAVRGSLADLVVKPGAGAERAGAAGRADAKRILELVRADPRVESACAQITYGGMIQVEGELGIDMLIDPEFAARVFVHLTGVDLADEFHTTELREALVRKPQRLEQLEREHQDLVAALESGRELDPETKGRARELQLERRLRDTRVADPDHPFAPPQSHKPPEERPLPAVLVGEQLARMWHLLPGDTITLYVLPVGTTMAEVQKGELSNLSYVVAGTFRTKENEMDLGTIYFERAELARFLGHRLEFTQVLVKLKDYARDGRVVRDELAEKLLAAGLIFGARDRETHALFEVSTWEDQKGTLLGAIENERVLMAIMLSLVVLVAAFSIFAILSMMVTEKRRDIGILSALGANPGGVRALFLLIAFWDALLGATSGAVAGVWLALKIDPIERWLSGTLGVEIFNRNVYIFDHLPAIVDPRAVAVIVLGAFLCTFVFALVPAWRAARLHPLDALRYE